MNSLPPAAPAAQEKSTTGWRLEETAPTNTPVLIYIENWEHYGPGIYRAIKVDLGTGVRWHTTAWACGRDLPSDMWPKWWMPLPEPPVDDTAPICPQIDQSLVEEIEGEVRR